MNVSTPAASSVREFDFRVDGNAAHNVIYSAATGFGFEPRSDGAASMRFSVALPEGNYQVTLRLGDQRLASTTTVTAEARRLMIESVATARGKFANRAFVVNVRTPSLVAPPPMAPGATVVQLKPRELSGPTWDDKLTLEFCGADPHVASMTVEAVDVPVLYLAGDSTVTDQADEPAASWGQMLPQFFAPTLAVANHAESGETLKSFLTASRLDKILQTLRAGDWLMIQFGHNDQKIQWPQTYVAAGSTYKAYLRTYIAEARRRGATPILVTSPERRNFDAAGHIVNSHGAYPDAVRDVAREEAVALVDLHAMSTIFYEALGPARAPLAFNDGGRDLTHHNNYGAYELARMIVSGIRANDARLVGELATHLATDAVSFNPARPDDPETFSLATCDARTGHIDQRPNVARQALHDAMKIRQ